VFNFYFLLFTWYMQINVFPSFLLLIDVTWSIDVLSCQSIRLHPFFCAIQYTYGEIWLFCLSVWFRWFIMWIQYSFWLKSAHMAQLFYCVLGRLLYHGLIDSSLFLPALLRHCNYRVRTSKVNAPWHGSVSFHTAFGGDHASQKGKIASDAIAYPRPPRDVDF
jgi:hypothetical protein